MACARRKLRGVSFELRRGEVLGVAGLVGSGRSELGAALFGMDRITAGTIQRQGSIGLVPEDRRLQGLMMQMSVAENGALAVLPRLATWGFLGRRSEADAMQRAAGQLGLHQPVALTDAVATLSGEISRRVLLGRWLLVNPDVLFLDDSTRGIDVGAKQDIYRTIDALAREGKGVILVSSELPELVRCCDRILVCVVRRPAGGDVPGGRGRRRRRFSLPPPMREAGPDLVCACKASAALAGIVILAIAISPAAADGSRVFLQIGNLTDILRQISLIGMIALAMTFVILTGGIDLSVGSILALSTAVTAMCLTRMAQGMSYGAHIALAIAAAVVVSGLAGVLNGAVIAAMRIQPFIVTLASMIGVRGLAKWITRNENIDIGFGQDVAAQFAAIFREKALVIGSYVCAAALFGVALARTVFGRHVRAIGDNETAARYAGLPIRRTKIWVYAISGVLSGFAGVLYAARRIIKAIRMRGSPMNSMPSRRW